jgi:dienelactone hydrolase
VDSDREAAHLDATVAWAKAHGGDGSRLGIMGFCRRGRGITRHIIQI